MCKMNICYTYTGLSEDLVLYLSWVNESRRMKVYGNIYNVEDANKVHCSAFIVYLYV